MKVLVVGGSSRAARAFRRAAALAGDVAVTVLVRRAEPALPGEAVVVTDDLFTPPDHVLTGAGAVINFAGITQGKDRALLMSVNGDGPRRLAQAVHRAGVRFLLHMSSVKVYGQASAIARATPEAPHNVYGESKLAADRALLAMDNDAFQVAVLRLPVLFGGGTGDNLRTLAKAMLKLGWFPVSGQPGRRSVLHVDTLAAIILSLLRAPQHGILFAAESEPLTLQELAGAASDWAGQPVRLVRAPRLALSLLSVARRELHARLYGDNLVNARDLLATPPDAALPLRRRLLDLFVAKESSS